MKRPDYKACLGGMFFSCMVIGAVTLLVIVIGSAISTGWFNEKASPGVHSFAICIMEPHAVVFMMRL